jgi:S-adenosylmethionine hydrolase
MPIVTLTTDYGESNVYLAALKGKILQELPNTVLVDFDHSIEPHNIIKAAFVVKNAAHYFPEKTIHLISTGPTNSNQLIIAFANQQYYIAFDNGLISLIFPDNSEVKFYKINVESDLNSFPELDSFPTAISSIINNQTESLISIDFPANRLQLQMPVIEENILRGGVVYIDGYDNVISNITRELFEDRRQNKSKFRIVLRRKLYINNISDSYQSVKPGTELALFNSLNLLEIAINEGNAAQLLGFKIGAPIIIEFYD